MSGEAARASRRLSAAVRGSAFLLFASAPLAAQGVDRVEVTVVYVSGNSVYLDRGREARIAVGDALVLRPLGEPPVNARIAAVARLTSRADILEPVPIPGAGVTGEVLVPEGRGAESKPAPEKPPRPVPEHPPWENPLTGVKEDAPLLSPAFGKGPEARPSAVRGGLFLQALSTVDSGEGVTNRNSLGRTGGDLLVENIFGTGGDFHFNGEFVRQAVRVEDVSNETHSFGRLNRLSYTWGLAADAPLRGQVGRFFHSEVPLLGLLDGVELSVRAWSRGRLGASFGAVPNLFQNGGTGDETSAVVFCRFEPGKALNTTLAYQSTWFKGEKDRDLLLWTADGLLTDKIRWHSASWVDFYGGNDVVKENSIELTQFQLFGNYVPSRNLGLDVSYTHTRVPELLRDAAITPIPANVIQDSRVDRVGAGAWVRLSETFRTDLRAYRFTDQAQTGTGGEARLTAKNLLLEKGDVSCAVYQNTGTFVSGQGFRVSAAQAFGRTFATLTYDVSSIENSGVSTEQNTTQKGLTGTLDLPLAPRLNLSLSADIRTTEGHGTTSLGAFLQKRF